MARQKPLTHIQQKAEARKRKLEVKKNEEQKRDENEKKVCEASKNFSRKKVDNIYDKVKDVRSKLLLYSSSFVRPMDTWRPVGKATNSLARSLIHHTLVKYEVPGFLYTAFLDEDEKEYVPLFLHLAKGGSMKEAVKKGLIKAPFTNKMMHVFLTASSSKTVGEAVRMAQVKTYGGDRRMFLEVFRYCPEIGKFGGECSSWEPFLDTVIAWMARNPMLDCQQIRPILDYLRHKWREDNSYSMKGRTVGSVMAAMAAWHNELSKIRAPQKKEFVSSGFVGWREEKENIDGTKTIWYIKEILSFKELQEEGRRLHHCVASYGNAIETKRSSIWSLRREEEDGMYRMMTIEVNNLQRNIVQCRGLCNRSPKGGETNFINKWATKNNLKTNLYW